MFEPVKSIGAYQDDALAFMSGRAVGAVFLPMGTGKTYVVIEWIKDQLRQGRYHILPVVIFAPKMVCHTWENEIEKFGRGLIAVGAYDGPMIQRQIDIMGAKDGRAHIVICNYEMADSVNMTPGTVVCDESTRIKNPDAIRSKAVYNLGFKAKHRWILTGSPRPKGVEDLYGQFFFLDRGMALGKTYWNFKCKFFTPIAVGIGKRMWKASIENEKRIREILSPYVFYRRREDCISMPIKLYSTRQVDMSVDIRRHTGHILEYWRHEGKEADNALTVGAWLRMLCTGFAGDWVSIDCNKYTAIADFLGDTDLVHDQVVIWTWFRKEQDRLAKILEEKKYKFITISGGDNNATRADRLRSFESGLSRIAVVSTATGAFGLNELRNASIVIYSSNSFDLELRQQSEDRTYRAGRTTPCQYIDFVTTGSIEQHIVEVLHLKEAHSKAFLEGEVIRRMNLDHRPEKSHPVPE